MGTEPLDAVSTACGRIRMNINGYMQEQQQAEQPQSLPLNIPTEHIRNLESQVWNMTHDLKRAEEEKHKLENIILEHFNSTVRPATEREIKAWIEGAKDNYESPMISRHNIFYTDSDVILPPLYGANSLSLIVGPNAKVFGIHNRGHNDIYFMSGFTKLN